MSQQDVESRGSESMVIEQRLMESFKTQVGREPTPKELEEIHSRLEAKVAAAVVTEQISDEQKEEDAAAAKVAAAVEAAAALAKAPKASLSYTTSIDVAGRQLRELKSLQDAGVITEDDFRRGKVALLSIIVSPPAEDTKGSTAKSDAAAAKEQSSGGGLVSWIWGGGKSEAAAFGCEFKCGFTGDFDTVAAHEKVCKCNPANKSKVSPGAEVFDCEFGCGFEGTFDTVAAHEKLCPKNPANGGAGLAPITYACEFKCGFEGAFAAVAAHEKLCPKCPTNMKPPPCPPAPAPAPAPAPVPTGEDAKTPPAPPAAAEVFFCEYGCGFEGPFDDVAAHEKVCPKCPDNAAAAPSSPNTGAAKSFECEKGCGFSGTFEEVAAHEKTCTHKKGYFW